MTGLIAAVAAASIILAAPAPQQSVLTLEQAVDAALENNQRIAIGEAGIDEAAAGMRQAGSYRLPRVDFTYLFQRTNNPVYVFGNLLRQQQFTAENFDLDRLNNPDALNNFTPQITVTQPIWVGGRVSRRMEAAELAHEAAGHQQVRTRQEVVFDTVDAYSGAVLARRHLAVAREAKANAEAHVELATRMRDGGLVVDSDVLQAQVRTSEANEAVARASSAVAISEANLNFVIGRPLDASVVLPDDLDDTAAGNEDLPQLIEQALATRPDLRATATQQGAIDKNIEAERASYMPEVGFTGFAESNSASMIGSQGTNWGIMFGAKITIYDGSGRGAVVDASRAQRRKIEGQGILLRRTISLQVTKAYHDIRAAVERVAQAGTAIELARENLRIVQNRYSEGLSTSVELLDAQTALTQAQTRAVGARRDVLMGRAALDLAVGR